jgi:hypothetical protein
MPPVTLGMRSCGWKTVLYVTASATATEGRDLLGTWLAGWLGQVSTNPERHERLLGTSWPYLVCDTWRVGDVNPRVLFGWARDEVQKGREPTG